MDQTGRDDDRDAFTPRFVGGGTTPGMSWWATGQFEYSAVKNGIFIHDLVATILKLLGPGNSTFVATNFSIEQTATG